MSNEIVLSPEVAHRQSTEVASVCKAIVTNTALSIQGKKYVRVEGWQSIATAHGCIASSRSVEQVDGGYRAIGEIRRMSDGALLATAEGFVGEDEPTWFGGMVGNKTLPRRATYAIRAMAQTRAISRACRSAFAHIVVLMDAGLSTTPAEEVPDGGFDSEDRPQTVREKPVTSENWQDVEFHFGKNKGKRVGDMKPKDIHWWLNNWTPGNGGYPPSELDKILLTALREASDHLRGTENQVPNDDDVPF